MDYAQKDGYRCAVLNHLGALPNIELTSPRMFTYGKTSEPTQNSTYLAFEKMSLLDVYIVNVQFQMLYTIYVCQPKVFYLYAA